MLKATRFLRADTRPKDQLPFDLAVLAHDERHLRRKLITLVHGDEVVVDLPAAIRLETGDCLVLEDGRLAEIVAAEEPLYEVRGRDPVHLMQLCWHIGNRHLPAQIAGEWNGAGLRVLIRRDHVIKAMLEGLGATVTDISEPFSPEPGAYAHGDHGHALLNR